MTWDDRDSMIADNVRALSQMAVYYEKDFTDDIELAYFFGMMDALNAVRNDSLEEFKFQNINSVYEISNNKIIRKEEGNG